LIDGISLAAADTASRTAARSAADRSALGLNRTTCTITGDLHRRRRRRADFFDSAAAGPRVVRQDRYAELPNPFASLRDLSVDPPTHSVDSPNQCGALPNQCEALPNQCEALPN